MLQQLAEAILPKEYSFREILSEAKSFQPGKKYTYELKEKPDLRELMKLVYDLQDDRNDLTILVEKSGDYAVTLWVNHAV